MKLIAHEHRRRVRGCRIYNSHLLPSALSEKWDSSLRFWCCHYGSLWKWQRWSRGCWWMLVQGPLSLFCPSSRVREALPTKWPRTNNMAPTARGNWQPAQTKCKIHSFAACVGNRNTTVLLQQFLLMAEGDWTVSTQETQQTDVKTWQCEETNVDSHRVRRHTLSWRVSPTQYNNATSSLHSYK